MRKTPTPVCSSSPPQQAGAQLPHMHVGKALLAGLLRRGVVATPGAHLPTPPSMLPVILAPLPNDAGLPGSAAKKRPDE